MACIDFAQGSIRPLTPLVEATQPDLRERLIHCDEFSVTRISGVRPFTVGHMALRVFWCALRKRPATSRRRELSRRKR